MPNDNLDKYFDGSFLLLPQNDVLPSTSSTMDSSLDSVHSFLLSDSNILTNNPIVDVWNKFQDNHTFLQGLLLTIAIKVLVGEVRRKIEKPIMDEAGRRVGEAAKENLTPDIEQINTGDWAKLGGCVAMDLAGDASELIPFLGEFTDVAFAPVEATLLQVLFKSPVISAFGFAEEILPFTDVIPTFTLSWLLATLFPTTKIAQGLLPKAKSSSKDTTKED